MPNSHSTADWSSSDCPCTSPISAQQENNLWNPDCLIYLDLFKRDACFYSLLKPFSVDTALKESSTNCNQSNEQMLHDVAHKAYESQWVTNTVTDVIILGHIPPATGCFLLLCLYMNTFDCHTSHSPKIWCFHPYKSIMSPPPFLTT